MLESGIKWVKQKLKKEHFDSFMEYTTEIEQKIELKKIDLKTHQI